MKHFLPFLLCLIVACSTGPQTPQGEPIPLRYATLLQMEESDSFTQVTIQNAWHSGQSLATYLLIPRNQPIPRYLPTGTIIRTPIRRAVVNSSVHAALFLDLQASNSIVGLADTAYIVSPDVKRLLQHGVHNVGSSMQPDLEQLHALRCDAIFVSPFENAGHGALDRLNVPIIECADYMETSPLARAEWMRFYGRLVGEGPRADSLFLEEEKSYNRLKEKVSRQNGHRPTVMCDLRMGNIWYQPGGGSTMGMIIHDAGGDYLWKDHAESGSLALDLESVYAKAHHADLWIIKNGQKNQLTYGQIAADCPQYKAFKPWKEKNIWVCNTLQIPYYEETPFHPSLLLESLVSIFQPECLDNPKPTYYQHLDR